MALADRWPIGTPQWRPAHANRLAHADFLADSVLAGCNGSVSRPANDANRLAAIVDGLSFSLISNLGVNTPNYYFN